MSDRWPKVFRDPVHDLIAFEDNRCDRLLLDLINTREVQRLRRIKQLGFTELVFPGANHSRFAHSLGVLHVARQMLGHFQRLQGQQLTEEQRSLVLVASLLHDIGHGPFSHAFEKVTGQKHEQYTLDIIQDQGTEVNARLRAFHANLPQWLTDFFDEEGGQTEGGPDLPPFLTHIVSSQMDADRCDYLLRDSHATGTNYGNYDLSWLIIQLQLVDEGKRFFFSRKALSAAEAYLFARFHMYRTVYFHKTTRAAEVMLRLLFQRFKELLDNAGSDEARQGVIPGTPQSLIHCFTGQTFIQEYTTLDDHTITEFLKACVLASDTTIRNLSEGLLNRRLFKAVDVSGVSSAEVAEFRVEAEKKLPAELLPRYSFVADTPKDTPYKPYDPDAEKPATQIYVETTTGEQREISQLSDTVKELRKQYELVRNYFPEEVRPTIEAVAAATVRRKP